MIIMKEQKLGGGFWGVPALEKSQRYWYKYW
jgi:hypothetical protein